MARHNWLNAYLPADSRISSLLMAAVLTVTLGGLESANAANRKEGRETPAERGFRLLTTKSYLPADFDQQVFEELWKQWEEPLRSQAEKATLAERRKMAFARYGLTENPEKPDGVALQYVDDGRGGWSMNCLACHSGKVAGQVVFGVPNSLYALQTLTEDVRATKLRMGKALGHMDRGSLLYPLGGSIGTTNAVMFGKILMTYRDPDLSVHVRGLPTGLVHHDHDAPPWWNVKKKTRLYADGFVPKNHRALMQFLLIPSNGPDKFKQWESDYVDILAWIESLQPPRYAGPIDQDLAVQGEKVFEKACAECHGTYGKSPSYPQRMVAIDEIKTDRIRLDSLNVPARDAYGKSWFASLDKIDTLLEPEGYIAPPLDGIWASAPYLHNGSIPTLWHLLNPDQRPVVWKRTEDGYDQDKVGLEVTPLESIPSEVKDAREARRYFDTRLRGKSAAGHDFPSQLSESERQQVLEYLKTL